MTSSTGGWSWPIGAAPLINDPGCSGPRRTARRRRRRPTSAGRSRRAPSGRYSSRPPPRGYRREEVEAFRNRIRHQLQRNDREKGELRTANDRLQQEVQRLHDSTASRTPTSTSPARSWSARWWPPTRRSPSTPRPNRPPTPNSPTPSSRPGRSSTWPASATRTCWLAPTPRRAGPCTRPPGARTPAATASRRSSGATSPCSCRRSPRQWRTTCGLCSTVVGTSSTGG